ncbi:alpha/beta hydrolase [Alkalicoccobacillus porphyridii]|uniref:Alpha/beta hydrolase n=1 Tax=Alkalicoccobacillus porphyridii TaxID=2597270 RepID=A0A553ZYT6_9BACI|nr:alpha/beta hydrolase [Alkalicoccobacillus porphyridii]TSB46546.1 alpha/beta hydrolase [Alkalicoccobacillus porphyridii]
MKKIWIRGLTGFVALLLIILISAIVWASFTYEAVEGAETFAGTEENGGYRFGDPDASIGIIFYPGAKVEPDAYNYLGHDMSQKDYFVHIPTMPFHLAVLYPTKANDIMASYPYVEQWYIGGHSLGGAMAASYTEDYHEKLSGLFLLAAYSASDLTNIDLPVLDISAGRDGLATPEKMAEYEINLPDQTTKIVIEEGNHANFGDYGPQKGDQTSSLTPAEQHDIVITELDQWIDSLNNEAVLNE